MATLLLLIETPDIPKDHKIKAECTWDEDEIVFTFESEDGELPGDENVKLQLHTFAHRDYEGVKAWAQGEIRNDLEEIARVKADRDET